MENECRNCGYVEPVDGVKPANEDDRTGSEENGTPFRDVDVAFIDKNELTLIQNRAQCLKCFQIIQSTHRHDFVSCRCGAVSVDGGLAYVRRVGHLQYVNELSVYGPKSISKSVSRRLEAQILSEV